MSQLFSYKWFRRTRNITELGLDYKEVGILLGIFGREKTVVFVNSIAKGGIEPAYIQ